MLGTHDLPAFLRASFLHAGVVARLERLSGCVYIGLGLNLLRSRPQPA
jgi:hypothetical protein